MNILPKLSLSKLKFNEDGETHIVVNFIAPLVDWQGQRIPVCLMLVIDVSGSMDGGKLVEAKRSAFKIIENLKATDYCGVAVFDTFASLIAAPQKMNQKNKKNLTTGVKKIQAGSATNFADGMVLGLREVNKSNIPKDMIVRVVMLTDGHANIGVSDDAGLCQLLNKEAGSATLSAFGYGGGANQDLLASIAKAGRGNYAFINNMDDALTTYAKELGGLLSMYARNLRIEIMAGDHKVSVVSDVPNKLEDGLTVVNLSDILSEEVRDIVVSVKTNALSQADALFEPVVQAVTVRVSYDLLKADSTSERVSVTYPLKLEFVNPGEEQQKVTSDLDEVIGKAQMVQAQLEAEVKAKTGDYKGAVQVMNAVSSNLTSRGHKGLSATSEKIGSKMNSHTVYAANAGYLTSTYTGGTRAVGVSGLDTEAAADLQNIGIVLTNDAQDSMVQSFTAPDSSKKK